LGNTNALSVTATIHYAKKKGLIESAARGLYCLTEKYRKALESAKQKLDFTAAAKPEAKPEPKPEPVPEPEPEVKLTSDQIDALEVLNRFWRDGIPVTTKVAEKLPATKSIESLLGSHVYEGEIGGQTVYVPNDVDITDYKILYGVIS
jgi:hypothetical protein